MSHETQPTFPKIQEFSTQHPELKKELIVSDFSLTPSLHSMQVSQDEEDAFRMKAITLLKSQGIPIDFKALRRAPVLTSHADARMIACYQMISPASGELIEIKGAFKRNGQKPSTPLLDKFQVTTHFKKDDGEWTPE